MLPRFSLLALTVAGLVLAHAHAADNHADKTRNLIAVLQSGASFFDKARACQQLGEFGNREAVAALAALLPDEHLGAYARSGLEGIPDPGAAEALRAATATLQGNQLAGVINSLGVLRDEKAIGLLRQLAGDPGSGVAPEALLALGRISTDESIQILQQTLVQGPETTRAAAAAACLLAAEKQSAHGHSDIAVRLYDTVRRANVTLLYRVAATRGAIVARKESGVPLLIEQLRSNQGIIRNTALGAIREIPCDALASALNAEIERASSGLQIQLLTALVDCHNAQSLPVLQAKTASDHAEVRKAALATLGKIGGAAEIGVLLRAATDDRSAEESALALEGLGRMTGTAIDAPIVQALAAAADPGSRIKLIRLVETRGLTNSVGELLRHAADPEARVGVAALRALKAFAGPGELSALIALTKSSRDDAVREAAENAVVGAAAKAGDAASGGAAVLAELQQATNPALKNSWIRILASLGYAPALPTILRTMNDPNDAVAENTIEQLGRWPDPTPIDDLLSLVQAKANPARTRRALASAIQLATVAADEHQRPEGTLVQWFERAGATAQTVEDRRWIISGLGRLRHPESLRLLTRYLDDPGLQNEAALAVVQIAPALGQTDPTALHAALGKIAATVKSADLRGRAAKLAATIPAPAPPSPLFDGRSLAGWEGNTNVWRVRDGVIVGGSLKGNPRNEFLATVGRYGNFVLRLEYRLVGTEGFVNGGVQFRSVRAPQPAHEMSGFQADIGAGYSGFLYDESRRNKFLAQPAEGQVKRLEKPGDWNRYEVRCAGPRVQIFLNGEKTVDYTETDPAIQQDGRIALQIHGNCQAEISFRNLTVEPENGS